MEGNTIAGGKNVTNGLSLTEQLCDQFDSILTDLHNRTEAECVLLVDISGQVIDIQGQLEAGDATHVAALAAGDVAAMTELSRQIGEEDSHGSFLHEGKYKSIYLFNVDNSFILIVVFQSSKPIGLIRLLVRRAVERLRPLTDDFEESVKQPLSISDEDFSAGLQAELDKAFTL